MIKKILFICFTFIIINSFSQTTINVTATSTGEEKISDGSVNLGSSDLEFYTDGSDQIVAVHFASVNIPKGSTITNAYIQFTGDADNGEANDGGDVAVNITGEDADDSNDLSNTGSNNISARTPRTTAIGWNMGVWSDNTAGSAEQTPDIKNIISTIISRTNWVSGNGITIIFDGVSRTASGVRRAQSGSGGNSPELHIEYTPPPAEIDILGKGVSIINGDDTPSDTDDTDFVNVGFGFSKEVTYTIENTGGETLNLDGTPIVDFVVGSDSEFEVITQPNATSLAAGSSLTFVVRFNPSTTASYSATISIENDDANEDPYIFDIQGFGVTPASEIDIVDSSSNAIDDGGGNSPSVTNDTEFGSQYDFIETSKIYTIENNGSIPLTISSSTSDNSDFIVSALPEASVLAGETTTIEITYQPSSLTTTSGTITINNNDGNEGQYTFTVQGTGITTPAFPSTISAGDDWFYLDNGSDQGTVWQELSFNQDGWIEDAAMFGYGDLNGSTATTVVGYGPEPNNKYVTTYFRKYINIADASIFNSIDLEAVRDDGMVVYINGFQVWSDHMPTGEVLYSSLASSPSIGGADETTWNTQTISSSVLLDGTNVVTVEIHQQAYDSSDISFDFKLTPSASALPSAIVERGPYLQTGTPTSVIVKWRTDYSTNSYVNYGTALGSLISTESNTGLTTEHEVQISGLTPNTKYYYDIGNSDEVLISENANMYIKTSPSHGTKQFVRMWALGDAGTEGNGDPTYAGQQKLVRDAYYNYVATATTNPGQTDMMLFLGDNAYNDGTDAQYQKGLFDVYPDMLKKSVAWSTLGNHDGYSATSSSQSGPYYDIFTFPKSAEANPAGGGIASSTEAYYSFDYANIHFIVLESYRLYNNAAQLTWCTNDIAATDQDWIVVFFHHPPYTKGSHDSDDNASEDGGMTYMRENYLPILEAGGVDLVLSGHSHSYERSFFINGHYGLSSSFDTSDDTSANTDNTVGINGHLSGRSDYKTDSGSAVFDAAYPKTTNEGAVYITTGSAGKATSALWTGTGGVYNTITGDHAAMYYSLLELGSTVIEIDSDGSGGQNMNVKFLRETGAIDDYFTINKSSSTLSTETYEEVDNKQIIIFPVPAKNLLNIDIATEENLKKVLFYNTIGALVKETSKQTINVSMLKTGMYMVVIETDKNNYYKSIIIE